MKIMKNRNLVIAVSLIFIAIAVASRFIEHPPNLVPLGAIAVVTAFYMASRFSWIIPLLAMLISDIFIGFYDPKVMIAVYGSYLLMWGLGRWARSHQTRSALVPATLLGSVSFFAITNLAVWAFSPMYAKTATGLYTAYAMGIPFFKWTLTGDVLYALILVAIIETAAFAAKREGLDPFAFLHAKNPSRAE